MSNIIYQADSKEVKTFLLSILSEILNPDKYSELKYMLDELKDRQQSSAIYISFSKAVRKFGKAALNYNSDQLQQADNIRKNWQPPVSVDKAIRLLILLEIPVTPIKTYNKTLENLFGSGDVGELVALYASLPVLPYPKKLILRCGEGVRTNMGDVFESVANNNPFPADYLSKDAFNQMVLKCLFVGKPLYKVVNLEHRLNEKLTRMAGDYAHERWAANRKVNPELWQLVAPYLEQEGMKDIERLIWTGNDFERQAAALVCSVSKLKEAVEFFAISNYKINVESNELNWHTLGEAVWKDV